VIETERLRLVWLTEESMDALVGGRRGELPFAVPPDWPDEHDGRFLRLRLRQLRQDPARADWGVSAIVLLESGEMVGHIGFHGPPGVNARREPGAVEVGYTVFPDHRRRGYAKFSLTTARPTHAYHDLTAVKRAWRGRGVGRALKAAQIGWAKANGFEELRTQNDERNEAIRRLNADFGYVPAIGRIFLRGPLA